MFKPGDLALVIKSPHYPELLGCACVVRSEAQQWMGYVIQDIEIDGHHSGESGGLWICPPHALMPLNPPEDMKVTEKGKEVTT